MTVAAGADVGAGGVGGGEQELRVGGEALQHVQAAGGEPEDGDLGALGHVADVGGGSLQRTHGGELVGVERVDEDDVDGAGGGRGLVVGVDAGGKRGEPVIGLLTDVELGEAADGLGLRVFLDGEVGLLEVADGVALGVGDDDVDDGFAGEDLEGLDGGGCGAVVLTSGVAAGVAARTGSVRARAVRRVALCRIGEASSCSVVILEHWWVH